MREVKSCKKMMNSLMLWMWLLAVAESLSTYQSSFVMKTNSYYASTDSIPYTQEFSFGQVTAPRNLTFQVQKHLPNNSVRSTTSEYGVFLTNGDNTSFLLDYSNQSSVSVTISRSGYYALRVFQFYSSIFTASEDIVNRFLVTLTSSYGNDSIQIKYYSILSYYYEKYVYLTKQLNSSSSIEIRVTSQKALDDETISLIKLKNNYLADVNLSTLRTKITDFSYLYQLTMNSSEQNSFYVIKLTNAKNGQDYRIEYPSSYYTCPYLSEFVDSYLVFQPCLCERYSYCRNLCYQGLLSIYNICLLCYTNALASFTCNGNNCNTLHDSISTLCEFCSNKPNYAGLIRYKQNACLCKVHFYWNPLTNQCQTSCASFASENCNSGDCLGISFLSNGSCIHCPNGVIIEQGKTTRCNCTTNHYWNPKSLFCDSNCHDLCGTGDCQNISFLANTTCIQCSSYAIVKNLALQCQCSPEGFWNPGTFQCENNCTNTCAAGDCQYNSFYVGTRCIQCQLNKTFINRTFQCDCVSLKQFWNPTSYSCKVDCSNFSKNDCGTGDCVKESYFWINEECLLSCGNAGESICGGSSSCKSFYWSGNQCKEKSLPTLLIILTTSIGGPFIIILIICICVKRRDISKYCSKEINNNSGNQSGRSAGSRQQLFASDNCPICLEGQTTLQLSCEHLTHASCFLEWFRNNPNICPRNNCRINSDYLIICKTCRIFSSSISMIDLKSTVKTNLRCKNHF